ncbi:amidophosphoribosyltransferase-like [Penaeus monodon]|uniref:amidophosphoribosyltransferase-like n=1 Tax=Penaeus monodon TaxID=6687 RepID=UPI0018A795CC|nr:amidophosphoribosyltransferase-like [Penaeus monodon]
MTEYHQRTCLGPDAASPMSWGSADEGADEDELREACGVFGCVVARNTPEGSVNVAQVVYLGLVALQHRGQESAGIVTSEGVGCKQFHYHKGEGLVASTFKDESLQKLKANPVPDINLSENRIKRFLYTLLKIYLFPNICLNGQKENWFVECCCSRSPCRSLVLVEAVLTRPGNNILKVHGYNWGRKIASAVFAKIPHSYHQVLERGVGLSTRSDSELITQMLSLTPPRGEKDGPDWGARIRHLMEATPTAYSLALMHEDKVYGVRDPFGNRPLCIGRLVCLSDKKDMDQSESDLGWVLSSESCAFQSVGATLIREVFPGEIIELSPDGIRSLDIVPRPKPAKPIKVGYDQTLIPHMLQIPPPAFCIFEYVYFSRADTFYEGETFSERVGLYGLLIKRKLCSVSRFASNKTFVQSPGLLIKVCSVSRFAYKKTFVQSPGLHKKKRLFNLQVHIRIASPPIQHPCYMGINIPTKGELIANTKDPEELAGFIGADSLAYLSIEGLVKAVSTGAPKDKDMSGYCTACLDGNYPVHLEW